MKKLAIGLVLGILFLGFILAPALAATKHSLVKIGGDVEVPKNAIVDDAVSVGGSVTVAGEVRGDAVAVGGSVILKSTAKVAGNIVSVGGSIHKEPGAIARGDITEVSIPGLRPLVTSLVRLKWPTLVWGWWVFRLLSFIGLLGLGILVVALFPRQAKIVTSVLAKTPIRSFLWGLLGVVLIVPIAPLLLISLIGIPLVPLWILLVTLAFLFGYVNVALLIGRRIGEGLKKPIHSPILEVILGMALLFVIGLVPFFGGLIKFAAGTLGLGGVILTKFGTEAR